MESDRPDKQANGDQVGGDKITVGDIEAKESAIAVGAGAKAEVHHNTYITKAEQPPLFAGVPAMPRHFVGRDEAMAGLIHRLIQGNALALSAEGLPGVGKTTLAVALAYHREVLAHFKDGVLWAGLGMQADPLGLLGGWAEDLERDISNLVTLKDRKTAVRKLIGQRSLLLVIDDAWAIEAA
jgi:hypothetical protein